MKPLIMLYWSRVVLGIVAAVLSVLLAIIREENALMNAITIALLVYLVSYYLFKAKFRAKVEKQSKIMTMGIGIYFFAWIVFTVLLYSIWYAFWGVPPA
jgi:hypothetical protein